MSAISLSAGTAVFQHRDLSKQVKALYKRGGHFQLAANKVKQIVWDLTQVKLDHSKVLADHKATKHGESRIEHCVKYDLNGFCRLVTVQDEGRIVLLYLGDHDDVERWLQSNRGLKIAITDPKLGLVDTYISDDERKVGPSPDQSEGRLYVKLKHYWDIINERMPRLSKRAFESFGSDVSDDEIMEAAEAIHEEALQMMVIDVFCLLRGGMVDEAKIRILAYQDELTYIEEVPVEDLPGIASNDLYINLGRLPPNATRILMSGFDWLEWMLFLHPSQQDVVDVDIKGSARLWGVSGSGKTCVLVHRAVRLAQKYPGERILVLTLNKSLAKLIQELISKLADASDPAMSKDSIEVISFWELGKRLIERFERHPLGFDVLVPKARKHGDTVDEVFQEYYTCQNNNPDAEVIMPVHRDLLVRRVHPPDYLRQEFDWIRSFLPLPERESYLEVDREGRSIPFPKESRKLILEGLAGWEEKMKDIGVIDYLGITNKLFKHFDQLQPEYRCILVDEVQDFGTLELKIIRKLVAPNENDLFLTGDIAQQVLPKHHSLRAAGIQILPQGYYKILKNYRNSREILEAAYDVFSKNTKEEQFRNGDFEVLNPEYANFSSPRPFLRRADSLSDEFASAYSYLKEIITEKEVCCIVLSGYSIFEVQEKAAAHGLGVLDGEAELAGGAIYLSDLEQTKGFEFDRVIILNANKLTFPNPSLPEEEWYREISKLYVAMTRAKKELVISYSGELSVVFEHSREFFTEDTWTDHVREKVDWSLAPPDGLVTTSTENFDGDTGRYFLYRKAAIGLSRNAQDRLIVRVTGRTSISRGRVEEWKTIGELKKDLIRNFDRPHLTSLFGGAALLQEVERALRVR